MLWDLYLYLKETIMSKDVNRITITGNLGAEVDARFTGNGRIVSNFSVAVNQSYRNSDGDIVKAVEWFRVVAWDKLGEICNEYLGTGSRVYIEGRLQQRKYTAKDGSERIAVEIIASEMTILSAPPEPKSEPVAAPAVEKPSLKGTMVPKKRSAE